MRRSRRWSTCALLWSALTWPTALVVACPCWKLPTPESESGRGWRRTSTEGGAAVNDAAFSSGGLNEPAERAELMATARELVPLLKAHASETERRGTPAPEVHAALRAAGFYTLTAPRKYGGREAGVRTVIDVFSELARGCGSSTWVAKIHCGSASMTALFDDRARQDVWGEDGAARPSSGSTKGAVEHGPRSTGRHHGQRRLVLRLRDPSGAMGAVPGRRRRRHGRESRCPARPGPRLRHRHQGHLGHGRYEGHRQRQLHRS